MNQIIRLGAWVIGGAALLAGCGSDKGDGDGSDPVTGDGDYVSANPGNPGQGRSENDAGNGTGGTSNAPTAGGDAEDDGADPGRAIEEADIIKLGEGKLYALSQYGGLSVIDISTRDELALLGRFKTDAIPFEMYLRDNVALALFNDYSDYEVDEAGNYVWAQSSRVLALDVSDPQDIQELGSFRIPGSISDSRIVGDVLYVVGYEDGGCWSCDTSSPGTTILSLDISDPMSVQKVDELRYSDSNNEWGWWRRSVTVTEQRMYVAGVEYGDDQSLGSTINIIDISDPAGTLDAATRVEAEGEISSRWQMDEYEGVLRVISQPPLWDLTRPPVVQTWTINSSESLTPLGRTEMVLPRPEQLQSVRFDGTRGYAITFQQTDPLFTLDLTDPALPKQAGELEMPGWVYHMEPRGDRVLGLGFDQGNPEGAVTVSLFDVGNMAAPTMIDRVNFGGDWGNLAEDQDRIHKAFNVLDEAGTILVPFSGYSYTDSIDGCGSYQSGVQLIDWQNDALELRGLAKSVGQARRGFLYDERLFTVSDERVQAFDIDDRSKPAETADLPLVTNVSQSAVVGDHVVRLSNDWWTSAPRIEVTTLAGAENPIPLGTLDLADVVGGQVERGCNWYGWYAHKLFSSGQYAYVLYEGYGGSSWQMHVAVIDVSDPTAPTLVGKHALPVNSDGSYYWYGYGWNLAPSGSNFAQIGTTLAALRTQYTYSQIDYELEQVRTFVDVIDLSDPTAPSSSTLEVPAGLGSTGLLASGDLFALSHYEAANSAANLVRFYLDRIDVSNPSSPELLAPVNIPGSLLAYDAAADGAVTVDYEALSERTADSAQCYETFNYSALFEPDDQTTWQGPGLCTVIQQNLKLVRMLGVFAGIQGEHELAIGENVSQSATSEDRTFITLSNQNGYYYSGVDCFDCGYYGAGPTAMPLLTMAGISSGDYALGRVDIEGGDYWSASGLVATGQRALLSTGWRGELSVVDGSNAAAPAIVRSVPVHGYVQDLDVTGGVALASLGYDGAQLIYIAD
jgi:hypothetical protein